MNGCSAIAPRLVLLGIVLVAAFIPSSSSVECDGSFSTSLTVTSSPPAPSITLTLRRANSDVPLELFLADVTSSECSPVCPGNSKAMVPNVDYELANRTVRWEANSTRALVHLRLLSSRSSSSSAAKNMFAALALSRTSTMRNASSQLCSGVGSRHGVLVQQRLVESSVSATWLIMALSASGIVVSLVFIVAVFRLRKHPLLRASSPSFLFVVLVGCIVAFCASIVAVLPLTDAICMATPWLSNGAFLATFGALFLKTWRITRIFINDNLHRLGRHWSNTRLLIVIGVLMLVFCVYMAVWMVVDRPRLQERSSFGNDCVTLLTCSASDSPFQIVLLFFEGIMLFLGIYQVWYGRNIADAFTEAKYIFIVFLVAALMALIMFVSLRTAVAAEPIAGIGVLVGALGTLLVMFVPKFVIIYRLKDDDDIALLLKPHRALSVSLTTSSAVPRRSSFATTHTEGSSTAPASPASATRYRRQSSSSSLLHHHTSARPTSASSLSHDRRNTTLRPDSVASDRDSLNSSWGSSNSASARTSIALNSDIDSSEFNSMIPLLAASNTAATTATADLMAISESNEDPLSRQSSRQRPSQGATPEQQQQEEDEEAMELTQMNTTIASEAAATAAHEDPADHHVDVSGAAEHTESSSSAMPHPPSHSRQRHQSIATDVRTAAHAARRRRQDMLNESSMVGEFLRALLKAADDSGVAINGSPTNAASTAHVPLRSTGTSHRHHHHHRQQRRRSRPAEHYALQRSMSDISQAVSGDSAAAGSVADRVAVAVPSGSESLSPASQRYSWFSRLSGSFRSIRRRRRNAAAAAVAAADPAEQKEQQQQQRVRGHGPIEEVYSEPHLYAQRTESNASETDAVAPQSSSLHVLSLMNPPPSKVSARSEGGSNESVLDAAVLAAASASSLRPALRIPQTATVDLTRVPSAPSTLLRSKPQPTIVVVNADHTDDDHNINDDEPIGAVSLFTAPPPTPPPPSLQGTSVVRSAAKFRRRRYSPSPTAVVSPVDAIMQPSPRRPSEDVPLHLNVTDV